MAVVEEAARVAVGDSALPEPKGEDHPVVAHLAEDEAVDSAGHPEEDCRLVEVRPPLNLEVDRPVDLVALGVEVQEAEALGTAVSNSIHWLALIRNACHYEAFC